MRRVLAGTLAWTAAAAFGAPPPELEVGCASPECSDRTGAPYCTVGGALRTAPSGATILLREGVCRETVELGKSVTLRGRGADATVIDAAGQGRVLRVHRDSVVVLSGVTLRHGSTELEDEKDGGGIWNSGDLTLAGVVVEDNLALDDGGGIRNDGRLRLVGSTVRNNRASSWGSVGGGLYNVPIGGDGIAEVVDSRVVGNEAGDNGGGVWNGGALILSGCTVRANRAAATGGGIRNNGVLRVEESQVTENRAQSGGGISNYGEARLAASRLANNSAPAGPDCEGVLGVEDESGPERSVDCTVERVLPAGSDAYREAWSDSLDPQGLEIFELPSRAEGSAPPVPRTAEPGGELWEFILAWGEEGAGLGEYQYPGALAIYVDPLEETALLVADTGNHRIKLLRDDGMYLFKWGESGAGEGQLSFPLGLAVDGASFVYIADSGNHRVQKMTSWAQGLFDVAGEYRGAFGGPGATPGRFDGPSGIARDPEGNLYVVDSGNARVQKFSASGELLGSWGERGVGTGQLLEPSDVAVDGAGHVYVTDTGNHRVHKYTATGELLLTWGGEGDGPGHFRRPRGVAVDGETVVFVSDSHNHRLQMFDAEARFLGVIGRSGPGPGELRYPGGLALDREGCLYVADSGNHRIQKFCRRSLEGP